MEKTLYIKIIHLLLFIFSYKKCLNKSLTNLQNDYRMLISVMITWVGTSTDSTLSKSMPVKTSIAKDVS